jgi:hypothetical protein
MSGGSFNYLCHAVGDAENLAARRIDMQEMADQLDSMTSGKLAARRTREVLALLTGLELLSVPLEGVWQAVEWWRSCDYSERQALVALAEFNHEHGSPGDEELSRIALEENRAAQAR